MYIELPKAGTDVQLRASVSAELHPAVGKPRFQAGNLVIWSPSLRLTAGPRFAAVFAVAHVSWKKPVWYI